MLFNHKMLFNHYMCKQVRTNKAYASITIADLAIINVLLTKVIEVHKLTIFANSQFPQHCVP